MARLFHAASAVLLLVSGLTFPAAAQDASAPASNFADATAQVHDLPDMSAPEPSDDGTSLDIAAAEATYVRLRNLAIAGDQAQALHGLIELLEHKLPPHLRTRILVTGISIATNFEDWPHAFSLLNRALEHLPQTPDNASSLLAAASHLYVQVGDVERAAELAQNAVQAAEAHGDDSQLCHATSSLALSLETGDAPELAKSWRIRQIEHCTRANDPLFLANGKFGLGKILAMQGDHAQALQWSEKALAEHLAHGYEAGADNARQAIALSLIALRQDPQRVHALLSHLSRTYGENNLSQSLADVELLWADLSTWRGNMAATAEHLREAMRHTQEAERSMRARQTAYFQIHFNTKLKEHKISLLETEKALAEATATAAHRRQLLLGISAAGLLAIALLLSLLLRRTLRDRQRYRKEAEHDGLTGLINQQHLYKIGTTSFAEAMQQGTPFTAVALDIDLFKHINDNYGHAAGDSALQAMAGWIKSVMQDSGIAARRGGDEFMLLVKGDIIQAQAMLQRLRKRISPITVHDQTFRFTISAGVCQADAQTASLAQLLHQADQALYRAKQQGRDRSVCWHEELPNETESAGSLVVVGSGIQFGRHASERTMSEIQHAQVVFCLADPFALAMISQLRPDVINLGTYYATGKDRRETYRQIDAAIMLEVLAGKKVCAVFYGHPGVFADVPHRVIRKTRAAGLPARMEPGISAEACLYADLGIDPGQRGVQSLEATHFLCFERQLDPQGLVLLWQVALAGDWSCRRLHAEREGLQALVTKLLRWYPPDHEVILYEAAQLPIEHHRAMSLSLCDLPEAHYEEYTTLVIPPLQGELKRDASFDSVAQA